MKVMRASVVATFVLLSGCGGGGSGTVSGPSAGTAPTPTPTPTPSPSPSPFIGNIMQPAADAVVLATSLEFAVNSDRNATKDRIAGPVTIPLTLSFDRAAQTYFLQHDQLAMTFGPVGTEIPANSSYPALKFEASGGGISDYLIVLKQPKWQPGPAFEFGGRGSWQHSYGTSYGTQDKLYYFTFGRPTPVADMPKTGKVRYQFSAVGNAVEQDHVWFASSAGDYIDVDFSTGEVTALLGLLGSDFLTGSFGGIGVNFRVNSRVNGNTVSGDATFDAPTFVGQYKIVFYGPSAEEIGVVYSGGSPYRAMYAASGVGSRRPPIN